MTLEVRRIVTGHDAAGKAVVASCCELEDCPVFVLMKCLVMRGSMIGA